jgi:hypothetical protein
VIVGGVPIRHLARPEGLREPGDPCYSLGMQKNAHVEAAQGAIAETAKLFEKAVKDGTITDLKQAEKWMKDFNAGVQSV